ncbi:MAG: Crp/Fnr family transcriptional regulator, partial [Chloroflexota bacterium]|nr:Crp/Fnr family transcriptional regulator [Chloroflexota bacterium]
MSLEKPLKQHPFFASLPPSTQKQLAQQAIPHNYQKDEWLVHAHRVWPYLFMVEKGKIIALKESIEGRSLVVTTIKEGEIFWGLAFFEEDTPMPVALVASEDSRIHIWSRERLLPILLKNGRISWELSRLMVKRMQRASEIVEDLAFRS